MADQVAAVQIELPSDQKKQDSGAGRSRVYIACSLCRQRKIKCGGEQPACRNCVRIEVDCHYDTEPKRRGPDKRPGTRTRTRKNANGITVPSTSRLQAGSGPSSETPLVPSQVGPERTRKRTKVPQVPSSNPGSSAPYPGVQVARPLHPTEFAGTSSILKTVAPILPDGLDHAPAATSNYAQIGSSFPQEPNQELYQSSQLSDVLAIHPILDTSSSLDVRISAGQHSWELGHDNSTRDSYANNLYAYPSGIAVSDESFISSNVSIPSSHSCGYMLPRISQSDSQHLLADAANIVSHPGAETGSIALPTRLMAHTGSTGTASLSLPLSTTPGGPSSPIFSTLQHTHDPHFRPPTDVFAGLAYPRDRMSVPALGRGRSNHAESGHEASGAMGNIREEDSSGAQSRFQVADEYSYLHGDFDQVTERTPDEEVLNKTLSFTPETCDSGYGRELTEDSGYRAPSESAYSDYSSSTQPSGRYISQGTSSGLTTPISHHGLQDDFGYSPHTDFIYGSSEDPAYASQTDGYSSDVQTPAEITVLPPPSGRGLIDFLDGAGNGGQYDDLGGSGYISSAYDSVSNPETGSTYNESTATEDEGRVRTDGDVVGYRHATNDLTQYLYYSGAGNGYGTSWVSEPSVAFSRQTWWDNLLETYAPTKSESALRITSDLKYLFKTSNYWISFINISLFMTNYNHKERRDNIQPSLILAALAYSTFTQSSEVERGQSGRAKAMELRNQAQAALEASLNSQRLDPTLAQAALLLALFEVSAHPEHTTGRSHSALMFLDGVIRLLGLTVLDAMDPQVAKFSSDKVPMIPLSQRQDNSSGGKTLESAPGAPTTGSATCACQALSIASTTTHAQLTPFWASSAGWDPNCNEAEIRREESRRLVWCALTLAAGFTAHDAAFAKDPTELHIIDAANYTLCFPAELMMRRAPSPVHSPHELVWALYGRAMLLWNSCLMLRKKSARMTDAQRAEFAVNVWLETNTIEEALNRHTCKFEQNTLFQGREYLFNTRMFISWEFRRYIPSPDTEVHQQFHRRKAEQWLRHQAEVAKRLMQGLHAVTGMASSVLGKRPYFVWWFMSQVSRCLSLWQCDQSLFIALEVARAFLPPIDYLTCLWPCQAQRIMYDELRRRLHDECIKYGLEPPPPPQLVIPTAIL